MTTIGVKLNRIYFMVGRNETNFRFFFFCLALLKRRIRVPLTFWFFGDQGTGKSTFIKLLSLFFKTFNLGELGQLTKQFNAFLKDVQLLVCHETRIRPTDKPCSALDEKLKMIATEETITIEVKGTGLGAQGGEQIPNKTVVGGMFLSNAKKTTNYYPDMYYNLVPDPHAQRRNCAFNV